jgi:hypothetical protein
VTRTGLTGTAWRRCKELHCVLVGSKRCQQIGDSTGEENLAIIANLSSSSNLMALEGLPEDLRKGIHEEILPHCYQVT